MHGSRSLIALLLIMLPALAGNETATASPPPLRLARTLANPSGTQGDQFG
jgi:hypothetical protein